jgi:hypothetical protein
VEENVAIDASIAPKNRTPSIAGKDKKGKSQRKQDDLHPAAKTQFMASETKRKATASRQPQTTCISRFDD